MPLYSRSSVQNINNCQAIVKELFIRYRKLNLSLVFIIQSYFLVPKEVRLSYAHYLITKIHNKRESQNIAINHSADIDCKDFMRIYRKYTSKAYSFLTIGTTLPANNPLHFRKSFRIIIKMTLTEFLNFLMTRLKQIKLNII